MVTATETEGSKRKTQPQCKNCRHPKSFHGGGKTRCRAVSCGCSKWQEPEAVGEGQVSG